MAKGYRIGEPEESIAWVAMNFEYEELSNWTTLLELAGFLGIRVPRNSDEAYNPELWNQVLGEFKRRYGNTRGIWICRKRSEAIYYYGEYGGDVFEVTYDPGKMIIDLGVDGIFVIEPFSTKEVGVVPEKHPSAYRDKNPRRLWRPRWVSINPSRAWHLRELRRLADVLPRISLGEVGHRQFHLGEMAAQMNSSRKAGAVEEEVKKAAGEGYHLSANPYQRAQNPKSGSFLHPGDRSFIQNKLKPFFGIPKLRIGWSDSKAVYPDIWCETNGIPRIVVTGEWQRQGLHERRKRLVHEAIHIAWKKNHGIVEGYEYSTYPAKDTYSWVVYQRILKRKIPEGVTRLNRNPKVESRYGIPVTYVSSLGFEVELPVARAVFATHNEMPISSGYHGALNNRWTIVYNTLWKPLSPRLVRAARKAGLEVSTRRVRDTIQTYTDVSLPGVGPQEIEKATRAFDNFARAYLGQREFQDRFNMPNPRRMGPPWDPWDDEEEEEDIPVGIEIGE